MHSDAAPLAGADGRVQLRMADGTFIALPPGSQVAYLVGDGIWSPTVIELSFRLVAVSEAAARSTLASIVRFALAATSLRRDAVAHRALQGVIAGEPSLAGVVARPVALLPHVWDVTLELLPRFEFWTTGVAETPAAYNAALAAQQEVSA